MFSPSRIVHLTEQTVDTLHLLGQQDRIVGISGYVVRPPQARREKPTVSGFDQTGLECCDEVLCPLCGADDCSHHADHIQAPRDRSLV